MAKKSRVFLFEGGATVSLSVTRHDDGTITIECSGDSITLAASPAAGAAQPKQHAEDDIPVLWPNGGATASIVADGTAERIIIRVPSVDELLSAIKEQHDRHAMAAKPTLFQFYVQGTTPLQVEALNKALSDLGNPEWMGTQFKLTGRHDE